MANITQGVKEFLKGSHQADSTEVRPWASIVPLLIPSVGLLGSRTRDRSGDLPPPGAR